MKLQTLIIIFILIMLPITVVTSQYIKTEINTINNQTLYDTRLNNATYDSIKAFQLNESNSSTEDVTTEKMRDVEASIKTFYNSLASGMGVSGYTEDELKYYTPCLIYTLYDGYYIYTLYNNNENKEYGLKPYVYYTEEIKEGSVNVSVSYTLDSYITVCGMVNGDYVNKSGYLYAGNYDKLENEQLVENIELDGNVKIDVPYKYMKFNTSNNQCIKYYKIDNKWYSYGTAGKLIEETDKNRLSQLRTNDINDISASSYITESKDFTKWVNDNLGNKRDYLKIEKDKNDPDSYSSLFNEHRREIIQKAIKSGIETSILNYNEGGTFKYKVPEIDETQWDKIINNVSLVSFMQGLPLKNKYYMGYSVVTNTQSREFVDPDEFYFIDKNNVYHKVTHNGLISENISGVYRNVDFRRKNYDTGNSANPTGYYYQHGDSSKMTTACYECVVSSTNALGDTLRR